MFPYPSGQLHMGHVRVYTLSDVMARYQRMNGYNVLHPMGWDAFGLPAENAAVERGIEPATWTSQNIDHMRTQLKSLGLSFNWDCEVATCSDDYYRWTQWLFLELYDAKLAYLAKAEVNWDPIDKTVLANEQVDDAGKSWRSGAVVEKRMLRQWFFKTTHYTDKLYTNIDGLQWPETVKVMQKHWIRGVNGDESRLRDWLVSRQRYWGTPIPIIHCSTCGIVPVPRDQLPVKLPEGHRVKFVTDKSSVSSTTTIATTAANDESDISASSPLSTVQDWVNCKCPRCEGAARRETDTMDTFVDSAWYFLRYLSPHNSTHPFPNDPKEVQRRMPVDLYVGGIEHAILHLLYARFITQFLHDRGYLGDVEEPFKALLAQGMVHGRTLKEPKTGRYLKPHEVDHADTPQPLVKGTDIPCDIVWEKMSKSKYNGVDPQEMIDRYGADAVRLFVLFKAPPEAVLEWDETQVVGVVRWLQRLSTLISSHLAAKPTSLTSADAASTWKQKLFEVHSGIITEVTQKVEHVSVRAPMPRLNVIVGRLMEYSNELSRLSAEANGSPDFHSALDTLVRLLAPLAPHYTAEFYEMLHGPAVKDVHQSQWPSLTELATLTPASAPLVVQVSVDGKHRLHIELPADAAQDLSALPQTIQTHPDFVQYMTRTRGAANWMIHKHIVAKEGRFINFVTKAKA